MGNLINQKQGIFNDQVRFQVVSSFSPSAPGKVFIKINPGHHLKLQMMKLGNIGNTAGICDLYLRFHFVWRTKAFKERTTCLI